MYCIQRQVVLSRNCAEKIDDTILRDFLKFMEETTLSTNEVQRLIKEHTIA